MKTQTLITLLLTALSTILPAQETKNWPQELANAMQLQAQGKYKEGTNKFSAWCKQQPRQALDAVEPYSQNAEPKVRSMTFSLLYTIGRNSQDTAIRSEVVYHLTAGCRDADEATSTSVCKYLQYFKKPDFSNASRSRITDVFNSKPALLPKLARLTGFLDLK